jgi:SAM-dependent methyltransferase
MKEADSKKLMDLATVQHLVQLNNDFYAKHFASFSSTRQKPWAGWEQGVKHLRGLANPSVADFAAGNLRFERYLLELGFTLPSKIYALDGCSALMRGAADELGVNAYEVDIISNLIAGVSISGFPQADLVCSFGFMHHIPSVRLRRRFLEELVSATKPGGYVFISLWEFVGTSRDSAHKDAATKASAYTARYFKEHEEVARTLKLEEDDYLLGWKNEPDAYRYCHNFSAGEVERMITELRGQAEVVEHFKADGKEGDSNHYLVLQRVAN